MPARSRWRLAEQKALTVSRRNPGDMVLGGDSVLALGRRTDQQKPPTWRRCAAAAAQTVGQDPSADFGGGAGAGWRDALASYGPRAHDHARTSATHFLDDYLAREGEALLGSVGGYHFEGRGAQLFESVEGDYFSILGLPLLPVLAELRAQGLLES